MSIRSARDTPPPSTGRGPAPARRRCGHCRIVQVEGQTCRFQLGLLCITSSSKRRSLTHSSSLLCKVRTVHQFERFSHALQAGPPTSAGFAARSFELPIDGVDDKGIRPRDVGCGQPLQRQPCRLAELVDHLAEVIARVAAVAVREQMHKMSSRATPQRAGQSGSSPARAFSAGGFQRAARLRECRAPRQTAGSARTSRPSPPGCDCDRGIRTVGDATPLGGFVPRRRRCPATREPDRELVSGRRTSPSNGSLVGLVGGGQGCFRSTKSPLRLGEICRRPRASSSSRCARDIEATQDVSSFAAAATSLFSSRAWPRASAPTPCTRATRWPARLDRVARDSDGGVDFRPSDSNASASTIWKTGSKPKWVRRLCTIACLPLPARPGDRPRRVAATPSR